MGLEGQVPVEKEKRNMTWWVFETELPRSTATGRGLCSRDLLEDTLRRGELRERA